MLGHPGGDEHSRNLIALADLEAGSKWLDMGAGDGATVRLLKSMRYDAQGIDLIPRGPDVIAGDYLHTAFEDCLFDGIISQCSFYVSGDVEGACKEASRILRNGGKLVFSDVTECADVLIDQCHSAGFRISYIEDLTHIWREYYLEALWTQEIVCLPVGKKFRYIMAVCEKE